MNKRMTKTIALASIMGVLVGGGGYAMADYVSQYDSAEQLIDQLYNIASNKMAETEKLKGQLSQAEQQLVEKDRENQSATQDMQMTINKLRQQIQALNETPCR